MKALAAAGFILFGLLSAAALAADPVCRDWSATVIFAEGNVDVIRAGTSEPVPLHADDPICLGDLVQTGVASRAAFQLPGDSTILMFEDTAYMVQISEDDIGPWINFWRGLVRIINRDPNSQRIMTPVANAGLRGTEVELSFLDGRLDVRVNEGVVDLAGAAGELSVEAGQQAWISAETFGSPERADFSGSQVSWARYFPQIVDGPLPATGEALPDSGGTANFLVGRAEAQLRSGSVEAARTDIAQALDLEPENAAAVALDTMILLTEGRVEEARARLARAVAVGPEMAVVRIVESYLLAHDGRIRESLDAATEAVRLDTSSSIAHARLAVVQLAVRANSDAAAAAESALALDSSNGTAMAVLGFVAVDAGETRAAREYFELAIEADPDAPLPRVGLALALQRDRDAVAARRSLEIAVALDPYDSIIRSYMGKAYFDERRVELAATQLDLASSYDSEEPTPYLYQAWTKELLNQSVAAYRDLTTAAALNGNRTLFRPVWGIDDDQVIAGTGIAAVYASIGYELQAILAGSHAVMLDPWDYAAHQLIADAASVLPRYQSTRVSEAYQALMFQPHNVRPIGPSRTQVNLLLMDNVGPAARAQTASRSSFTADGLDFQTSGLVGGRETRGETVVLAGLSRDISYNIAQSYFETDGFRENNDLEHRVATALIQVRLSDDTSIQGELRSGRTDKGDTALLFDDMNYDRFLRQREEVDSLRFGVSHRVSPFTAILGSVRFDDFDLAASSGSAFDQELVGDGGTIDMQIQNTLERTNIVSGIRALHWGFDERTSLLTVVPVPPFVALQETVTDFRDRSINAYVYANRSLAENLELSAGVSFDWLDAGLVKEREANPKLGLTWRPAADTFLRLAAFQTVQGPTVSKQLTPGYLEPTQVAGFSQFLFATAGEIARNLAFGVDHALTPSLRIGVDRIERSLDIPFVNYSQQTPQPVLERLDAREVTESLNLYWTPLDRLAVRTGWENEDFDYGGKISPYSFSRLRTERVPVAATVFFGHSISLRVTGTYARQEGSFDAPGPAPGPGPNLVDGRSRLWVVDASVDYRLPNRLGTVEIAVKNLFDDNSNFQDTDPENPRILPERTLLMRLTLDF